MCVCVIVEKPAWEKRSPGLALITLWRGPYRSLFCSCCCGHNGRRIDFNCVIKQVVTTATTVVACISLDLNLFMETAKQSNTAGNAQFPNFIFTSANVAVFHNKNNSLLAIVSKCFFQMTSLYIKLLFFFSRKATSLFLNLILFFAPFFFLFSLFFIVGYSCLARRDAGG